MPQETVVRLLLEHETLRISFECRQNPLVHQNTLTEHNEDLWKQEVFEVFIAEGSSTPTRYLELEINPNNALFAGWIDNPTGEGDGMNLDLIPYEKTGIVHHIIQKTNDLWTGELQIPFALIGKGGRVYRLNFYRIILLKPQTDPAWICSPDNSSFQCWRSTHSGVTPRFHRPESFGKLMFD